MDYLADRGLPVTTMKIVESEGLSVERVTGRPTRGRATDADALPGPWIGLFVGIAFSLFGGRSPSHVQEAL